MLSACEGSSQRVGIYNFVGKKQVRGVKITSLPVGESPKASQCNSSLSEHWWRDLFPKCVGGTGEGKIDECGGKV